MKSITIKKLIIANYVISYIVFMVYTAIYAMPIVIIVVAVSYSLLLYVRYKQTGSIR